MLIKILFSLYFFMFRFENYMLHYARVLFDFSYRTQAGSDYLQHSISFERALKMQSFAPDKSVQLFHHLIRDLNSIEDSHQNYLVSIKARSFYHLGKLSSLKADKISYYQKCIQLLPNHNKAKDRLAYLLYKQDDSGRISGFAS